MEFGRALQHTDIPRDAAADMDGDELLAADRVGHRRRADRGADVEAPERLQRLVVVSGDRAVDDGGEDEAAGGRQHAGINGVVERAYHLGLAGRHIDR